MALHHLTWFQPRPALAGYRRGSLINQSTISRASAPGLLESRQEKEFYMRIFSLMHAVSPIPSRKQLWMRSISRRRRRRLRWYTVMAAVEAKQRRSYLLGITPTPESGIPRALLAVGRPGWCMYNGDVSVHIAPIIGRGVWVRKKPGGTWTMGFFFKKWA